MIETKTMQALTFSEQCMPNLRWVPLSPMQAHRQTLQQLWEITEYRDDKPYRRRQEWRDVPIVFSETH